MRLAAATPGILAGRKNADQLLDLRSRKQPDALAIAYLDDRYTWQELRAQSDRLARFLAAEGVGAGDRVALMIDNRPEFLFVFHAVQRLGAVAALINTNLSGRNLAHVVRVASPAKLVFGSEHAGHLAALREHLPELDWARDVFVQRENPGGDLAGARCLATESADVSAAPMPPLPFEGNDHCAYIYTSGTTGLPKAAIVSHMRMLSSSLGFAHLMFRTRPGDVTYVTLPLYHSSAMFLGWGHGLISGSAMALRRKFSTSQFFADARKFRATSFLYIGELCRYLLNSPEREDDRDHSLRLGVGNGMRVHLHTATCVYA